MDRIDISVISTTTKSAANTTTTNKRKLTPKMNRIGKKHAKKKYDCLVTNWVHTYSKHEFCNWCVEMEQFEVQ